MRIPSEIAYFKAFSAISKKLSTTYTQYGKSIHKSNANKIKHSPISQHKRNDPEEKSKNRRQTARKKCATERSRIIKS